MRRGRAWRRAQNQRIINKRKRIIKDVWCWNGENPEQWVVYCEPGRLNKWNFTCSCFMCKMEKHTSHAKRRREDREYERTYSQVFHSNNFAIDPDLLP